MDGHYLKDVSPELGEAVLVYRGGAADDFRASMFGIRNRKVVWIVLRSTNSLLVDRGRGVDECENPIS